MVGIAPWIHRSNSKSDLMIKPDASTQQAELTFTVTETKQRLVLFKVTMSYTLIMIIPVIYRDQLLR